ncbi:MAG: type II toxin-antitoxin system mRNA interferase toxin, RelE/StbE family [Candidatus Nomurabacteria bacterium]|nr:type II toxin-antitoxin system mRNA interferase toxin, RelE/StbE family [Candidatus Nomurabacteria bacterium]
MIIHTTSKFRKAYKKMPEIVKNKAEEKERIFIKNPFDKRLDTHKLHGKYRDYQAFTVVGQYRIMFIFVNSDTVDFLNIGTHEIYK